MRPTQLPPPSVRELGDTDAPDWLEANRVAVLAFLDGSDAASAKMRERLSVVMAGEGGLGVAFGVVDVSEHTLVAEALGVTSVPMVLVFVEGSVVDRLIGTPPEAVIRDVVKARAK